MRDAAPAQSDELDARRAVPVENIASSRERGSAPSADVLRRRSPKRPGFSTFDRLVFICLYRIAPRILDAFTIVEPETVLRWHRAGFRLFWRWKFRRGAGRPKLSLEVRQLIREMSLRQLALGRSPHPWRAPQAWYRRGSDVRRQVHGAAKAPAVAGLENVPPQSCKWDRLD